MRTKYKFIGTSQDGKILYWQSVSRVAGDSRVEEIRCGRAWFWQHQ